MNHKSHAVLIVLSVILLLLIAGCGKNEDKKPKDFPFLGGTKGIEIGFLKDSPPNEITDGNTFPFRVVLSIKNEGEFDLDNVDKVRVDLKGILSSDFNAFDSDIKDIKPESAPIARIKDSEGNIREAVETFATIPKSKDFSLLPDIIKGNTEFTFRADVCYQYGTNAISKICILENMISPPDDAICNPRGDKKVFSSSSPVQVTKFRQTVAAQNKLQFSFDIVHSGQGNVFENVLISSSSGCPKDPANRRLQEDFIGVTVKTGLNGNLECITLNRGTGTSSGRVKLVDNKRTITCTQDLATSRTDLERNVDIELKFDYADSVDRKVLAKHLEGVAGVAPTPPIILPLCTGTGASPRCIQGVSRCVDRIDCRDASSFCRCSGSNELACEGTCSTPTGQLDNTPPEVGVIEPEFAVAGIGSQLFVIQNVFDKDVGKNGNGVAGCKFILDGVQLSTDFPEWKTGKEFTARFQGPPNCRSELHPCDFFEFIDIPRHQEANFQLRVECANKDGAKNTARAKIIKIKKPDAPQTPIPADVERPQVGNLLIDIATIDSSGKIAFVVFDQRVNENLVLDKGSGIEKCEISLPGFDEFNTPPRNPTVMSIGGPTPCLGEKDQNDLKDGSCIAEVNYDYSSKRTSDGSTILQPGRGKAHKIV